MSVDFCFILIIIIEFIYIRVLDFLFVFFKILIIIFMRIIIILKLLLCFLLIYLFVIRLRGERGIMYIWRLEDILLECFSFFIK